MKKIVFLLIVVLLALGGCSNTVEVDGAKVTYDELQTKIESRQSELDEIEGKLTAIKTEFAENDSKYKALEALAKEQDEIKQEVETKKAVLEETQEIIDSVKEELATLQGEILKYKDEPIKINPGFYYFGSDIESGRYKITAQEGQRGNVFIRKDGRSYVGETFGDGTRSSVKEFTFRSIDGDEIEAKIPIYLFPVD